MNNHIYSCRLGTSADRFDNHVVKCRNSHYSNSEPYFEIYAFMQLSNEKNDALTAI